MNQSPLCTDSPSVGGVSSSSTPAVGPIVGGIFSDEIDHSQFTQCIYIITITGVLGGIIAIIIVVIAILVIVIVIRFHKNRDSKNKSQFIMILCYNLVTVLTLIIKINL